MAESVSGWQRAFVPTESRLGEQKKVTIGIGGQAARIDQIMRAHSLIAQFDSNIQPRDIKIVGIGKDKIVATAQKAQNQSQVFVVAVASQKNKREENIRNEATLCEELRQHSGEEIRLATSLKETNVPGLFTMDKASGDLEKFLGKTKMSPNLALSICQDMATGLSQLHSTDRVHDDMKLDNFLVSNDGKHVYLSDFGKSTKVDPDTGKAKGPHGGNTRNADSTGSRSKANDVYGLGLSLMQVLEATVREEGKKSIVEVPETDRRKDQVFADDSRRGVERFILNHKAFSHRLCETKNVGWMGKVTNILCRGRTAIQPAAIRQQKDKAEHDALSSYVDTLIKELEKAKKFDNHEIQTIRTILSGTVLAPANTRISAADVRQMLEGLQPRTQSSS